MLSQPIRSTSPVHGTTVNNSVTVNNSSTNPPTNMNARRSNRSNSNVGFDVEELSDHPPVLSNPAVTVLVPSNTTSMENTAVFKQASTSVNASSNSVNVTTPNRRSAEGTSTGIVLSTATVSSYPAWLPTSTPSQTISGSNQPVMAESIPMAKLTSIAPVTVNSVDNNSLAMKQMQQKLEANQLQSEAVERYFIWFLLFDIDMDNYDFIIDN